MNVHTYKFVTKCQDNKLCQQNCYNTHVPILFYIYIYVLVVHVHNEINVDIHPSSVVYYHIFLCIHWSMYIHARSTNASDAYRIALATGLQLLMFDSVRVYSKCHMDR